MSKCIKDYGASRQSELFRKSIIRYEAMGRQIAAYVVNHHFGENAE